MPGTLPFSKTLASIRKNSPLWDAASAETSMALDSVTVASITDAGGRNGNAVEPILAGLWRGHKLGRARLFCSHVGVRLVEQIPM